MSEEIVEQEVTEEVVASPEVEAPEVVEAAPAAESEISSLDDLKEKASKMLSESEMPDIIEDKPEEVVASAEDKPVEDEVFTPTLSYKVRDEELKMDDWVKDKITSEEDQKKFQDLYTRGHGLEIAKKERDTYKEQITTVNQNLEYLKDAVNRGDVADFINVLGLPKDAFIKYAIKELQYQEMSPEQRAVIDQQNQMTQYQRNLELQNQQLMQNFEQSQTSMLNNEIDMTLNSGEYKEVANNYDARVGRPGAFRQLVVERGIFHEAVNKTELTVAQAAQDAVQLIGGFQAGANLSQQQASAEAPTAVAQQQKAKPTLPNFQGQGTSPTKRVPNSIQDLRNRYKEMSGQL